MSRLNLIGQAFGKLKVVKKLRDSRNVVVTYKGRSMVISQWADKINVEYGTLWSRLNVYGWSVKDSLTTPVRASNR